MYQFVENIIGRLKSELHLFLVHAQVCGVKLQHCIELFQSLETIWQCLHFWKTELSMENIQFFFLNNGIHCMLMLFLSRHITGASWGQ